MKKRFNKIMSFIFAAVLLLCLSVPADAVVELPDGSVAGLPEKLVVLDDEGQSVNELGEYFFQVEGMREGVTYTKKVQIMNMRQDKSYEISFRAEPLTNIGSIDLEKECTCHITLDGKTIYDGKVTGEGTPNITLEAASLGKYAPGQSRMLVCSITWNGSTAGGHIDNGRKVVTAEGTVVEREKTGSEYISGQTTFKWIFFAQVAEEDTPVPHTGGLITYGIIILVLAAAVAVMLFLVHKKKKAEAKAQAIAS